MVDTRSIVANTSDMTIQDGRQRTGALVQIQKVLELEARKGYSDSSATNGVTRFAGERIAQVMGEVEGDARRTLQDLDALLASYRDLDPEARERVVTESLSLLRYAISASSNASPSRPAPSRAEPPPPQPKPAAAKAPATRKAKPQPMVGSLSDSVLLLPMVGDGRARQLGQVGVRTIRDLIYLFPRRYVDYSNLEKIGSLLFGQMSTIQGVVQSVSSSRTRTGKEMIDVVVQDETGWIHAIWFNPYIQRQLPEGTRVSLSGRVEQLRGTLCLKSPEWEVLSQDTLHTGRIAPVYPLTKGLYQKTLRTLVRTALDRSLHLVEEHLPPETLQRAALIEVREAIEWIHFPEGDTPDEARRRLGEARKRLAFDELLLMQLGLLQQKLDWQGGPGNEIAVDREVVQAFVRSLPFALTSAQNRALGEILRDMASPMPMTRLLQGDVGSGKTAIAAAAALAAINDGYQAAIMAPTELLAEQHLRSLIDLFANLPDNIRPSVGLITGSMNAAARREVYSLASDGGLDLVVGTQALIQESMTFSRLGFAVVDEQHRFGVDQRSALRDKGTNPDVLVMTATPIPRSLALTIHGDLDVSTLDELPPGRQPIETRWIPSRQSRNAYAFVRDEIAKGRQAFIVFPLVEESETIDAKSAVAEHERLSRDVFPDLRLGLLHGRMRPADKDEVMLSFRDGEIDVLVSTSVVEVGIDVPNATVMLIEGAERFGLAQLHQFRGRVGRGAEKSYCLLVSNDAAGDGRTRLQAMVDSQDGFRLAQIDLDLRGPGDFLGKRQSGLPELSLADFSDVRDLERARNEAQELLAEDPDLELPQHRVLAARVNAFWSNVVTEVS
ncbi:ATP-dependent DNA helicase RecG [soil metagenome]